ncbi:hypothetical protein [Gelidibacter maritimus]|uniref:Lipocalin-like domain-containing protein n=1 Tax=Gelidibacter maritimus TaxID=2761487 RepID=A0A7W2M2P3_9FLAO|nr:hypothetical protein [Gelidibacter maritimus]MBA6151608.1 hypothetical protein [Gelidibacter maritimus]
MKNLHLIYMLLFSMALMSCSSDDTNNDSPENPAFEATINGGTFSNYGFKLGAYEAVKGPNGTTLRITMADKNGKQMTLFLNSTGGFNKGTVKQMGDVDSDKFRTYVEIKDNQPATLYFSQSGNLKITNNREHPSKSEKSLISGEFNIEAITVDGTKSVTVKGSFNDLEFVK